MGIKVSRVAAGGGIAFGVMTLVIISIGLTFWISLFTANCFFTEAGALTTIQGFEPRTIKIIGSERSFYNYSVIKTEDNQGVRHAYFINTDILFNLNIVGERKD